MKHSTALKTSSCWGAAAKSNQLVRAHLAARSPYDVTAKDLPISAGLSSAPMSHRPAFPQRDVGASRHDTIS